MKLIAHRGFSAEYPDNTLIAFQAAIDAGFTEVECDVQQTRDGVLVLCHDLDLSEIAKVNMNFRDSDYADFAAVDVGSWFHPRFSGERLARFEDLLALLPDWVELHVDLKQADPPYDGIEQRVVELTRNRLGNTTFASLNVDVLRRFRDLGANLRLGFQPAGMPIDESFDVGRELNIESLRLNKDRINTEWMRRARAENWEVYVYPVYTSAEYTRLESLGVDRVFTSGLCVSQRAA